MRSLKMPSIAGLSPSLLPLNGPSCDQPTSQVFSNISTRCRCCIGCRELTPHTTIVLPSWIPHYPNLL